ncbi:uroporphyrin-III C-methyltransferase [Phenylobacterium zucineum HLK1]|uniref:uroporphyrinogen-III C-methyltransferase n=1 Tax=Phenylobacterium zucineum (strain HLK1) TaxID=450851 RepID=B4RHC6_PHEZH|nr:uroporphyrinogen-III C-methyltransferase [Phenylobacterium zucineum]ACG77386.1 uroporphyrin-III C-methyltransferase [Phenylobacterium zucineum HLK1]
MPPDPVPGRVRLVGAGPGAADLLTVRALRAVQSAQALLYDALVPEEIVALAPAACLKVQTGKRAGRPSLRQETINRLMLRLARRGLDVVRLKGGDPSVFGRVGEEAAFLAARGVAVEIVPGVTAACAAAAQFGFPLTHRGEARRVVFATATLKDGAPCLDMAAAADPQATVALYMGGGAAPDLAAALVAAGRSAATPALVLESVGRPDARILFDGTLAGLTAAAGFRAEGPVLLVVGEAVARGLARGGAGRIEAAA